MMLGALLRATGGCRRYHAYAPMRAPCVYQIRHDDKDTSPFFFLPPCPPPIRYLLHLCAGRHTRLRRYAPRRRAPFSADAAVAASICYAIDADATPPLLFTRHVTAMPRRKQPRQRMLAADAMLTPV